MSTARKIKAGVIGGAGYTGGELIRLLIHHPAVEITFVHSNSSAGKFLYQVHTDLLGDTDLKFSSIVMEEVDVLFLCVGHGEAQKFLSEHKVPAGARIIDLSQDHRSDASLQTNAQPFIYGLPEVNRHLIQTAVNIANPGCFATSIQLGLLPMAASGLLNGEVHISSLTGSTGAGQSLSETSHFSWRNNNISVYKAFKHQHLAEIVKTLSSTQKDFTGTLNFIPGRGGFSRGILSSIYLNTSLSENQLIDLYTSYYQHHPFVHLSESNIDLKQVINTNKCMLHLQKHDNKVLIISIIDNLLKGASGQALQNMNLMFGLEERTGLNLKATAF